MSWLLFMDESGHDHKNMPFEVRGGVALHACKVWAFIQAWKKLERDCFGTTLDQFGKEAKGHKLLDRDRFKWANQRVSLTDDEQRKYARSFLEQGAIGGKQTAQNFTGYGRASVEMARGALELLFSLDAKLFAALIPRGTIPPIDFVAKEDLRKDHVFLFERYYYFLNERQENGLIIMDQSEKQLDTRFVNQMDRYFTKTGPGRNRTDRIVPAPLFVDSDMTYGIQAADICLYCINWGFRLPSWSVEYENRVEIRTEFGPKIQRIQWSGVGSREGSEYQSSGIVLVKDPYEFRPKQ